MTVSSIGVPGGAVDYLEPTFYRRAVAPPAKVVIDERTGMYRSLEEPPRGVYTEQSYVRITHRTDRNFVVDEPATDAHRERWPQQWAAYLQADVVGAPGLPIERHPLIGPAMVAALRDHGVATLGQLAELPDADLERFDPTVADHRDRARQFLRPVGRTEKELNGIIVDLKKQLATAQAELAAAHRARAA